MIELLLSLVLTGTIVSSEPKNSFAQINGHLYQVGQKVEGYQIVKIVPTKVTLKDGHKTWVLDVADNNVLERLEGVERCGDRIKITKKLYEYVTDENLPTVIMQAASEAVYDERGNIRGFGLYDMDTGSIFDLVGLEDGDVVIAIDGQPLDGVLESINLLKRTRAKKKFTVTLIREGQEKTFKIEVI